VTRFRVFAQKNSKKFKKIQKNSKKFKKIQKNSKKFNTCGMQIIAELPKPVKHANFPIAIALCSLKYLSRFGQPMQVGIFKNT